MFKPNIDALLGLPGKLGLDAVVAMSPENFVYASGAGIETVATIRPRQAFAVTSASGKPFALVCSLELDQTVAESWIDDIRTYTEFVDDPVKRLAEELKRGNPRGARVGLDLDYIPATDFERLRLCTPNVEFVNTTNAIAEIRAIKTNQEIDLLEAATKATHRSALDALAASALGDDERMIAERIARNMITTGAQTIGFLYFASGDRTIQPHAHAVAGRVPQPGDIIRFDVCGKYGIFASDFARTYSAGDPTQAQKQYYTSLVACQTKAIEVVRPGVAVEDIFYACREEFQKNGLPFHMPHVGHSFGVELHEKPMLRPGDKTKLKPGMVLNIEPGVRDDEGSMFHTEDLVVVTEDGFRLLTLGIAPKELPVLGQNVK